MVEEKQSISHTLRKFCKACENPKYHFARGMKISHTLQKPIRIPCENFAGHAKNSHTHLCFAKMPCEIALLCENLCQIREGVQTHFATLCEVQQSVRKPTVT